MTFDTTTVTRTIPRIQPKHIFIACLVVVIVCVAIFYYFFHHASAQTAAVRSRSALEQVTVEPVSALSPNNAPLSVIGKVTSQDEATVLAQTSGEIVEVDKQLGDQVSAGDVIARFENSSQQAAVLQAQGAYNAAVEALTKAGGSVSGNSSDQAAVTSRANLVASLQNAYSALDDAVHTKADTLFNNPRSANPTLLPALMTAGNDLVLMIQNERQPLDQILARDQDLSMAASTDDLNQSVTTMTADAQTIEAFLDNLIEAVNALQAQDQQASFSIIPQATVTTYQTALASARTEVNSAITSLTALFGTNDVATQQAQVQEAQGAYDAAESSLSKTIVTSPISGTIIALPVTSGDYVQSFSEVAEVSNPSSLKIVAHVSADDAQTLSVGNAALVNGNVQGSISSVAPAIDPQTGAIEVDISLPQSQSGLVDQDSVSVDLTRNVVSSAATASASAPATPNSQNIVPIVALKITPTGPIVFTVQAGNGAGKGTQAIAAQGNATTTRNASSSPALTLVSHPVTIGSILGSNIVVTSGLTPDMKIVTDARGLTAGESVSVARAQNQSIGQSTTTPTQ